MKEFPNEVDFSLADLAMENRKLAADHFVEQVWQDYRAKKGRLSTGDLEKDGAFQSPCACSYLITDVQLVYPDGYPNVDLAFGTPSNWCSGGSNPNPFEDCQYFSDLYHSFFPDCVTILNPDCTDVWPSLPPPPFTFYPFSCDVERFSDFLVRFQAIALSLDNCINAHVFPHAIVKFKVYCQEVQAECGGQGYGYVSPEITLEIPQDDLPYGDIQDLVLLKLGGDCGCQPFVAY